jgi:hypothetical protein
MSQILLVTISRETGAIVGHASILEPYPTTDVSFIINK